MPYYTCFTENRNSTDVKQVQADNPVEALREAIASLPYDDGQGPFGEELDWLQQVAGGVLDITMHQLGYAKNTWLWMEGANHDPKYLTYVVKTDLT